MKLFRRKAEPPVFEPVRELSGIEKMALEAEYKRRGEIADRYRERREKFQAQIDEIEKAIGPQLRQVQRLKQQLACEYPNSSPGNISYWPSGGVLGEVI